MWVFHSVENFKTFGFRDLSISNIYLPPLSHHPLQVFNAPWPLHLESIGIIGFVSELKYWQTLLDTVA